MIYMYKTLRIHTFIHICCIHIYLYICYRVSHDRFILYKSASTANVYCSYRNRYSINTLPLSDALEWNAFSKY